MVTSCSPKMPKTVESYKELAQRDLEIIEAQRDEIAKLKGTVNNLRQKLKKNGEIKAQGIEEAIEKYKCNNGDDVCFVEDLTEYAQKLRGEE